MTVNEKLCIKKKHGIKNSSNICFGYLLESPQRGDSNKYPKHIFYEKIRIKQGLSYMSFCPLRIVYNSKFIIMATFFRTSAVVVTRVHCILNVYFNLKFGIEIVRVLRDSTVCGNVPV